jgi:peptidoglycan/LPS O-acetylase OafA/YrhL
MAPSDANTGTESRNLDLLRAFAVLSVFGAHLSLTLIHLGHIRVADQAFWDTELSEVGLTGVLIFFVHTALVLMRSLDRTGPRRMVLNFYIRRMFRIYPLSIACIAAVLLFQIPQFPDGQYAPWNLKEISSNLLLIQNITRQRDIILPLWTLPREVQMYLILPFIYLLLKRFSSSIVVLILWFAFFAAVPPFPSLYPVLSCFPSFMGGVFAYQLAKERVFRIPSVLWPAIIAVLFGAHIWSKQTIFGDYRMDYVMCMLLGLLIPNVVDLHESWLTRTSRTIAKYSYGIYLCHDPILWVAFTKLASFPGAVQLTVLVLLMVAIPVTLHHFLEAPMIETGRRLAARWTAAADPAPVFMEEIVSAGQ